MRRRQSRSARHPWRPCVVPQDSGACHRSCTPHHTVAATGCGLAARPDAAPRGRRRRSGSGMWAACRRSPRGTSKRRSSWRPTTRCAARAARVCPALSIHLAPVSPIHFCPSGARSVLLQLSAWRPWALRHDTRLGLGSSRSSRTCSGMGAPRAMGTRHRTRRGTAFSSCRLCWGRSVAPAPGQAAAMRTCPHLRSQM